jgi:OOP family OmpA-OmpF porin
VADTDEGAYVGTAFGASRHQLKKVDFGPVGGASPTFDGGDRAGKLYGGYRLSPYLSIEAQYLDLGKSTAKYAGTAGTAKEDYRVHALSLAAVGSLPVSDSVSLFAKAGPAVATAKTEVSSAALGVSASSRRTVLLAGIGATVRLSQNLEVRAEYERLGQVGKAAVTGRAAPSAFTLGVGYRF